jgi:signal transduction histidine kinase
MANPLARSTLAFTFWFPDLARDPSAVASVQVLHDTADASCNPLPILAQPANRVTINFVERILAQAIGQPVPSQELQRLTQDQKRELLTRLLAHVAHELRNPLSSLDIHVQLLEEDVATGGGDLAQRTGDRFQIIHGELRRLENVVTRFLHLAGPPSLSVVPLSVNKLISHTCELLRPQAEERGIDLAVEFGDALPEVEADADQLTQAFINLVINALQAASRGGHVVVRTAAREAGVAIEFIDDGNGIAPENQDRIFEPYFTTRADGSGLGLWITQQIVHAHGGTLRVTSTPTNGATFTLTLPTRRSHG